MDGGLLVKPPHGVEAAPFLFRIIIIINYKLIDNKFLLWIVPDELMSWCS